MTLSKNRRQSRKDGGEQIKGKWGRKVPGELATVSERQAPSGHIHGTELSGMK